MSSLSKNLKHNSSWGLDGLLRWLPLCLFGLAAYLVKIFIVEGQSDIGSFRLSRILLQDSELYARVATEIIRGVSFAELRLSNSISSIIFASALVPVVYLKVDPTIIGVSLVGLAWRGFDLLAKDLNAPNTEIKSFILLNPMTLYFAQSLNKELFILASLPWLLIAIIRRHAVVLILSLFVLAMARIFFLAPVGVGVFIGLFKQRLVRAIFLISFVLFLPYVYYRISPEFVAAAQGFMGSECTSLNCRYIASLGNSFYASLFLPVRILQVFFEPLFANTLFADGPDALNMYYLASLGGVLAFVGVSLVLFFRALVNADKHVSNSNAGFYVLVCIVLVVSSLPFIHNRYVYPLLPLALIYIYRFSSFAVGALKSKFFASAV